MPDQGPKIKINIGSQSIQGRQGRNRTSEYVEAAADAATAAREKQTKFKNHLVTEYK